MSKKQAIPAYGRCADLAQVFDNSIQHSLDFWTRAEMMDKEFGGFWLWYDTDGKRILPFKEWAGKGLINVLRLLYMHALVLERTPDNARVREQLETGLEFIDRYRLPCGNLCGWIDLNGELFEPEDMPTNLPREVESINPIYTVYIAAEIAGRVKHGGALALAEEMYQILEKNGYDHVNDGYYNTMLPHPRTDFGKNLGQNMHAAIGIDRLLKVSGKAEYKERLATLYRRLTTGTVMPSGFAYDYMTEAWELPLEDIEKNPQIPVGHNIEMVWYLEDVANTLGAEYSPELLRLGERALGVISPTYEFPPVCGANGEPHWRPFFMWWSQMEAMISAVRLFKRTGDERYLQIFWKLTERAYELLVNPDNGVFYGGYGFDTQKHAPQGGWAWKGGLHVVRSLMACNKILKEL